MDSIRKKEDALYKKSPKRYHHNLRTDAGLQPCAKDQPNLSTITDPNTGQTTSHPQSIMDTLYTYFEKEQSRVTPETLPTPPWLDPNSPDPYITPTRNPTNTQQLSLDQHLTRSHCNTACQRAPQGKAPGPDSIPNEIIKHLPEQTHDAIYQIFHLIVKHRYTPKKWCVSAIKVIYKPNKTDPNIPSNYRPIALVICILKLWTSILTNIGTHTAETEGIFSDTAHGFRAHRQIYDSLATHIMTYEDAKLSKNNIYAAYSDFKGAFGGIDHQILFQIMRDYGFPYSYIATCEQLYASSNT